MPLDRKLDDKEYFELTHHEDGVINHRLTWLLAGQPLLFLAYVTVAGSTAQRPAGGYNRALDEALIWIPRVGCGMATAVLLGVIGAALAIRKLTKLRATGHGAGVSFLTTLLGLTPPVAIPLLLAYAWFRLM